MTGAADNARLRPLHSVYARHSNVPREQRLPIPFIRRCVKAALEYEGVGVPCEVSVLITNDETIRKLNREHMNVDDATDVLSFPMFAFEPGCFKPPDPEDVPGPGKLLLGDIVVSAERLIAQAGRFGHPLERETAYLTVHSALHLLGYDHTGEASEKQKMRAREEEIIVMIQNPGTGALPVGPCAPEV